jgi:hypothetical protein
VRFWKPVNRRHKPIHLQGDILSIERDERPWIMTIKCFGSRSRWLCILGHRSAADWFLGSRVRIPLRPEIFACYVYCVGSGLCDELITHSEESCWVCGCVRVSNCVWSRNLSNEAAQSRVGLLPHKKNVLEGRGRGLFEEPTQTFTCSVWGKLRRLSYRSSLGRVNCFHVWSDQNKV